MKKEKKVYFLVIFFMLIVFLVSCSKEASIENDVSETSIESNEEIQDIKEASESNPVDISDNPFKNCNSNIEIRNDIKYYISENVNVDIAEEIISLNNYILDDLKLNSNFIYTIAETGDFLKENSDFSEYVHIYSEDLKNIDDIISATLEKTNIKKYPFLMVYQIDYLKSSINNEKLDINMEDIQADKLNKELFTLDPIFSIEKINSFDDYQVFKKLATNFSEFIINEYKNSENRNIISDILNNQFDKGHDYTSFLHNKWLKSNGFDFDEIKLSQNSLNDTLTELKITTPKGNIVKIEKAIFTKYRSIDVYIPIDVYLFLDFFNNLDYKREILELYLDEKDLLNANNPLTIRFKSSRLTGGHTNREGNEIELGIFGIKNSTLHEMTHASLKINQTVEKNINNDPFRHVYEEGLAEYIEYTLDDYAINSLNEYYLKSDVLKDIYQSSDYRRNTLLDYLEKNNYKDDFVDAKTYIHSCAYLSLTDEEFLNASRSFSSVYEKSNCALNSYEESASFVMYLIDTYGKDKFFELRRRNKSFKDIYNLEYKELLTKWLEFLGADKEYNIKVENYKNEV